jgi:hypothetical protein
MAPSVARVESRRPCVTTRDSLCPGGANERKSQRPWLWPGWRCQQEVKGLVDPSGQVHLVCQHRQLPRGMESEPWPPTTGVPWRHLPTARPKAAASSARVFPKSANRVLPPTPDKLSGAVLTSSPGQVVRPGRPGRRPRAAARDAHDRIVEYSIGGWQWLCGLPPPARCRRRTGRQWEAVPWPTTGRLPSSGPEYDAPTKVLDVGFRQAIPAQVKRLRQSAADLERE